MTADGQHWAPASYTTPLYFQEDELCALPGPCQERARAKIEELHVNFQQSKGFILEHPEFFPGCSQIEDFRWAFSAVNTRCVYLDVATSLNFKAPVKGTDTCALAPFLDMLNHHSDVKVEAKYNPSSCQFEITTDRPSKRGQQVFIHYGPHDNSTLLLEYGFVLPKNANNVTSLDDVIDHWLIHVEEEEKRFLKAPRRFQKNIVVVPDLDKKKQALAACGLLRDRVCNMEGPSWVLLATAQVLTMGTGDLRHASELVYDPTYSTPGAFALIGHWITLALAALPPMETNASSRFNVHMSMAQQLQQEARASLQATLDVVTARTSLCPYSLPSM